MGSKKGGGRNGDGEDVQEDNHCPISVADSRISPQHQRNVFALSAPCYAYLPLSLSLYLFSYRYFANAID